MVRQFFVSYHKIDKIEYNNQNEFRTSKQIYGRAEPSSATDAFWITQEIDMKKYANH